VQVSQGPQVDLQAPVAGSQAWQGGQVFGTQALFTQLWQRVQTTWHWPSTQLWQGLQVVTQAPPGPQVWHGGHASTQKPLRQVSQSRHWVQVPRVQHQPAGQSVTHRPR
jgi:hypothetical protein